MFEWEYIKTCFFEVEIKSSSEGCDHTVQHKTKEN